MFENLMPTGDDAKNLFDADCKALYPAVFAELAPAIWALCMGAVARDEHNDAYTNSVVNAALVAAVQLAAVGGASAAEIIDCATINAQMMIERRTEARAVMDSTSTIGNRLITQLVERNVAGALAHVTDALNNVANGIADLDARLALKGI